jgi:hypothetical protein
MTTAPSKPNPDYITVKLLGSGYAAVHMRHNTGGYDVHKISLSRYVQKKAAITEARMWSASDEIELRL